MITEERVAPASPPPLRPATGAPSSARRSRTASRSRRPVQVSAGNAAASAVLTLLTIVTAVGMCRVFSDWEFLRTLVVMAVVVHGVAMLLRVLRVHAVLAMPAALLVVYEMVAILFYPDTMRFGLPGADTMRLLRVDVRLVWEQFPSAVPPVPSVGAYLVIAAIGIGVVALLADAFAFRAFGRAEAVVPAGVLFIFTAALGTDRSRVGTTALWLAVALVVVGLLRALHGGADESWLGRRGRTVRAAAPAAVSLAVVAALAASVVGPLLPGADSEALLDTHQAQSDVTEVVSPLVNIRSQLVNRSNTEMFTVEAGEGRYWRLSGLTEFDGSQWGLPDDRPLQGSTGILNEPGGGAVIQQRIRISRMGGNLLPAAFAPVTVDGDGVMWLPETDTLVMDEDLRSGAEFILTSADVHPSADALRATTATAPSADVLALPSDFPEQVRQLARDVVAGQPTAYDQARALQDYFRGNFDYDLRVQQGHTEDAILTFLRIKRGYCEQFAATFAAMARSLGIPARVAVGFTPGELQADGKYHVYGKQAHAWPEVWFDGYGWVAFEPTPGRGEPGGETTTGIPPAQDTTPLPVGSGEGAAQPTVAPTVAPVTAAIEPGVPTTFPLTTLPPAPTLAPVGTTRDGGIGTAGWVLLAMVAVGAWMLLMPATVRRSTRRGATPSEQVIDAWHGTVGALQLAGAPPLDGATPLEYASLVEVRLPIDHRSLVELARFVTRAIYAPSGVGEPAALRAAVLRTQLENVAREVTPWRTRVMMRLDPRLVRLQLVGDERRRRPPRSASRSQVLDPAR